MLISLLCLPGVVAPTRNVHNWWPAPERRQHVSLSLQCLGAVTVLRVTATAVAMHTKHVVLELAQTYNLTVVSPVAAAPPQAPFLHVLPRLPPPVKDHVKAKVIQKV